MALAKSSAGLTVLSLARRTLIPPNDLVLIIARLSAKSEVVQVDDRYMLTEAARVKMVSAMSRHYTSKRAFDTTLEGCKVISVDVNAPVIPNIGGVDRSLLREVFGGRLRRRSIARGEKKGGEHTD
jgi:hypothetical protein